MTFKDYYQLMKRPEFSLIQNLRRTCEVMNESNGQTFSKLDMYGMIQILKEENYISIPTYAELNQYIHELDGAAPVAFFPLGQMDMMLDFAVIRSAVDDKKENQN